MKFRKKPVVIEAVRYDGGEFALMRWVEARAPGKVVIRFFKGDALIDTLEGAMRAQPGDWIICGVKGEFYPCKPDIFAATYEPVEEPDAPEA